MNPSQARAARAILKLGVREVADLAKVTPNTVSRIEQDDAGPRGAQTVTVEAIRRVYEDKGITFLAPGDTSDGGYGVRLTRKPTSFKVRRSTPEDLLESDKQMEEDIDKATLAFERAYFAKHGKLPSDEEV